MGTRLSAKHNFQALLFSGKSKKKYDVFMKRGAVKSASLDLFMKSDHAVQYFQFGTHYDEFITHVFDFLHKFVNESL